MAHDSSLDEYRSNVATIVDELLVTLPPCRIFVITTPDHTLTSWGAALGLARVGHAAW